MTMTDPSQPRTPGILDEEHLLSDPKYLRRHRRERADQEGHAGSHPRGNPESEHDEIGRQHEQYERVLGH
jgi:hypothetical protein